jgi:hypothetical protein
MIATIPQIQSASDFVNKILILLMVFPYFTSTTFLKNLLVTFTFCILEPQIVQLE